MSNTGSVPISPGGAAEPAHAAPVELQSTATGDGLCAGGKGRAGETKGIQQSWDVVVFGFPG